MATWKNILRWTDTRSMVARVPDTVPIVPESDVLASSWISVVQSFAGHLTLRESLKSHTSDVRLRVAVREWLDVGGLGELRDGTELVSALSALLGSSSLYANVPALARRPQSYVEATVCARSRALRVSLCAVDAGLPQRVCERAPRSGTE